MPYATPDWFVALADTAGSRPAGGGCCSAAASADARILLEVERGGQLLRHEWLTLRAGEQRRVAVESGPANARGPLTSTPRRCATTTSTRHEATVQVAEQPQPLRISLATFRDRLLPGQRETWRHDHPPGQRPARRCRATSHAV
ncbi:MAG: hypothetical protein WKG07_27230 [Hymenobacter sp.]